MTMMAAIPFVVAAGISFVAINIMTPFLYDLWFNHLAPTFADGVLKTAGNNMFGMWQIMSFIVPGLIIIWGFAVAHNKTVREEEAF